MAAPLRTGACVYDSLRFFNQPSPLPLVIVANVCNLLVKISQLFLDASENRWSNESKLVIDRNKIIRREEKELNGGSSLLIRILLVRRMKIPRVERIYIRRTIVSLLIRFKTRPRPPVCIVGKHENRYSQWNLVTVVPLAWSRLSVVPYESIPILIARRRIVPDRNFGL